MSEGLRGLLRILRMPDRGNGNGGGGARSVPDGFIRFERVSKVYETGAGSFCALREVDLTIQPGELISIVGKSGSGKTTLVNMLTGIDMPSSGGVFVGGTPVHELDEGARSVWRGKNVGVVFQFFQLLPALSIIENVRLPMDLGEALPVKEREERAMALLEKVDLADAANLLPSHLSGGQQQRAAIARALANDPPIIATDEPTGNLDTHASETVMRLFEDLVAGGKTVLMVTHDAELARHASRIIRLSDGEIVQ
jgi:putative ABC transport system ATP-binding protein